MRVEGRDRSALRCEFKCRPIRANVSGIRKIGNRFLIPRENSSFTLVSPLDRRRKDQRCLETQIVLRWGGGGDVLLFRSIDEESWRSISFPCFFENRSKENSVDILEGGIFKENLRKFRVASSGSRSLD